MRSIPDVLGYRVEDALAVLDSNLFKVVIKESLSKKNNKQGEARVLKLKSLSDYEVEIIISYF